MYSQAKEKKLSFFITSVKGTVLKVLTLTKLHEYLPLSPTIQEAILSIKSHPQNKES